MSLKNLNGYSALWKDIPQYNDCRNRVVRHNYVLIVNSLLLKLYRKWQKKQKWVKVFLELIRLQIHKDHNSYWCISQFIRVISKLEKTTRDAHNKLIRHIPGKCWREQVAMRHVIYTGKHIVHVIYYIWTYIFLREYIQLSLWKNIPWKTF